MPGDQPKDLISVQVEVNRQAMVEVSKRLTGLEHKFASLEEETRDLAYFANSSLETAKRVQGLVKKLIDKQKSLESQGKSDDVD